MPQLPHNQCDPHHRPGPPGHNLRGLVPLHLPRPALPPLLDLRAARQEHHAAIESLLRTMARQSQLNAPPDFSASLRDSLSRISLDAAPSTVRASSRLADIPLALSEAWSHARMLVRYRDLNERQRRVALGGAGTLGLALLCLLGLALDPGEIVAALSLAGALAFALLAVGHLLSATVAAILGSGLLAVVAVAVYLTLAALWVRLVRLPVEA